MNLAQQLQSIGQWSAPAKPRTTKSGEANKRTVLAALKDAGKPIKTEEIAERTGLSLENCRLICERLMRAEMPMVVRSGEHGYTRYSLKGMK